MSQMTIIHQSLANPRCNAIHLSVQAAESDKKNHIYIHPGMLTSCKRHLAPGGTGELVRDYPYTLTYTRLGPQKCMLTLEHSARASNGAATATVHAECIDGHRATVLHSNPAFTVTGFDDVVDAIFLREFFIPSLSFPPAPRALCIQAALKNTAMKNTAMKNNAVQNKTRSLLGMHTAKRMLFFNSNAVSRFRSLFHNQHLNYARNLCLTVALAHAGTHAQQGMFIANSLQYAPLTKQTELALNALREGKAASRIDYLTTTTPAETLASDPKSARRRVYLHQASPEVIQLLRTDGVAVQGPTAYVAFTERSAQPILIANVRVPAAQPNTPNQIRCKRGSASTHHYRCTRAADNTATAFVLWDNLSHSQDS